MHLLKTVPGSKERSACFHDTYQRVCILLFTVLPTGSISEEEESFTLLFLLSIISSYHGNNSIGYSKFYLDFFQAVWKKDWQKRKV